MMARPDSLRPVTAGWLRALQDIVEGIEFDIAEPLSENEE